MEASQESHFVSRRDFEDGLRSLLGRIEDQETGAVSIPDELEAEVRGFLRRAQATGRLLDSATERRRCQGDIDYVAKLLESKTSTFERWTLAPFDPDALKEVPAPPYPFDDLRTRDEQSAPSVPEIEALLAERASAAGLRFADGLIADLAREVQGEPQGFPLLEFGLRYLYDHNRIGNKIFRRAAGGDLVGRGADSDSFSCKATFAERLKAFRDSAGAESKVLRAVLVSLTRGAETAEHGQSAAILDGLESARLVYRSSKRGGGRRLVYEGVVDYWPELMEWVVRARARRRYLIRGIIGGLGFFLLVSLLVLASMVTTATRQERANEAAIQTFQIADPSQRLRSALDAAGISLTAMTRYALFVAINLNPGQPTPRAAPTRAVGVVDGGYVITSKDRVVSLQGLPPDSVPCGGGGVCGLTPGREKRLVAALLMDGDRLSIELFDGASGRQIGFIDNIRCEGIRDPSQLKPWLLKISFDEALVSYTCPRERGFHVWAISDNEPKARTEVERINRLAERTKSHNIYFSETRPEFILVSESGLLTVNPLNEDRPEKFVVPTLGVISPVDVAVGEFRQVAVLDEQNVLSVYEPVRSWLLRLRDVLLDRTAVETQLAFQINVLGRLTRPDMAGPPAMPVSIDFTDGDQCIEVKRARGSADDYFVDRASLVEAARRRLAGQKGDQDPCRATPR